MQIPYLDLSRLYNWQKEKFDFAYQKVLNSGRYMDGENTQICEEKTAKTFNYKHSITVGSCSDAIYFSLLAAGVGKDDEVLLTSFSFVGSVMPIYRLGARAVFVDIDPKNALMETGNIEKLINKNTKAIVAVHLFGNTLDMEVILKIAKKHNLIVIEDAAQSAGVEPNYGSENKSDFVCTSFDPTKVIHAFGTGGAVVTNNEIYFERIKKYRYHGKDNKGFEIPGYNSRMSEIQCAKLNIQIDMLQEILEQRKHIANKYFELLKESDKIKITDYQENSNFHKIVIRTAKRDWLKNELEKLGIQSMIHYPKSLNKYFGDTKNYPEALKWSDECLSLPIFYGIKDEEVNCICEQINRIVC